MQNTIIGQGSFRASFSGTNPNAGNATDVAGNQVIIQVPQGCDWIEVYNFTASGENGTTGAYFNGTGNASIGTYFYWQVGMPAGSAIVNYKGAASAVLDQDTLVSGGFTIYDPTGQMPGSLQPLGNPVATTASTNATRPVVSTGSTAGLSVGSVVRMSNTAQTDVNGIDMVVGAVSAGSSFTLLTATNPLATAPGAIGGAGFYRIVNTNPLFYPRRRYVVKITQAVQAQVSTSVAHGLTAGQEVHFNIPQVSGMVQLNPTPQNNYLPCTVVSVVDDYNFLINVDTTGFTAFTWPTIAQQPSNFPQVIPFGEDTAGALASTQAQVPSIGGIQIPNTNTGILADSTVNTGFLGVVLGTGGNGTALTTPIIGPAGSVHFSSADVITATDLIFWKAGKSDYVV
jgi:hypothetical protein